MTRRFWASVALTSPILGIDDFRDAAGKPLQDWLGANCSRLGQFLLATPGCVWGGWPFFVSCWQSIVNRRLNMFTLIALGTGAAYLYSVVARFRRASFPASFRGHQMGVCRFTSKPAAVIVTLVLWARCWSSEPAVRRRSASGLPWPCAKNRSSFVADGTDENDVSLDDVQGRRSSAGASGREDSGRWSSAWKGVSRG